MIDDDLLSKFDMIDELSVSEEMLGAYLEGNLNFLESSQVESSIASDLYLTNLLDEVDLIDNKTQELFNSFVCESLDLLTDTDLDLPIVDDNFHEIAFDNTWAAGSLTEETMFFNHNTPADVSMYDELNDNTIIGDSLISEETFFDTDNIDPLN